MGSLLRHSMKGIPLIRGGVAWTRQEPTSATVLYAHLHGYDALAEALPPAAMAHLLGEFFELLSDSVLEFGGLIFQIADAGMMAGFGVGDARHAGIREAVMAALHIQRRFTPVRSTWQAQQSIDAAAGVGIHRGDVALAEFGPPEHSAPTLVGDTVHIAAQLCRRARAGEVLLTSTVYLAHCGQARDRASRTVARRELPLLHLPSLKLHGRQGAVDAWCVPVTQRLEMRRVAPFVPPATH